MFDRDAIHSILVVKLRHIGDVLLTAPLFANLRSLFPHASINALVYSGTEEMLTGNPAIDRVYVYDRGLKQAPLWRRVWHEAALLSKLRRAGFDLVMNLTEGDRGAIAALVSAARWRVGMDSLGTGIAGKNRIYTHIVPRVLPGLHAVEQNLEFLKALGIQPITRRVSFHFDGADAEAVRARLAAVGLEPGRFFQAHCTSRWMFKTMPPATAARMLDLLMERSGLPCLLTTSPERKEREYLDEVQRHLGSRDVPVFSDLRLKQLGALTATARFFAGVDSAPMHIAAALDVPVLGVFGPSSAQVWGPWNNELDSNPYRLERGIQANGKHVVLQSAKDCVPCLRDGCNGSKTSDCLNLTADVFEAGIPRFLGGSLDASGFEASEFRKRQG